MEKTYLSLVFLIFGLLIIYFTSSKVKNSQSFVKYLMVIITNVGLCFIVWFSTDNLAIIIINSFVNLAIGVITFMKCVKSLDSLFNNLESINHQLQNTNYEAISYSKNASIAVIEDLLHGNVKELISLKTKNDGIIHQLNTTTKELHATIEDQTVSMAEQSSSLNETASTIKELGVTSDQTTDKANMVVQSAEKSMDISRRGHEAFKRSVSSMLDIRNKVERIAVQILELSSHTQKIGSIINTVDDIAETTNLLALNASIEASKAGEFGKGFQVVASEIRKLAEQSQRAVAEVADIIAEIQNSTNSTVMATEEGTKGVDIGVDLINKAGNLMEESISSLDDNLNAAHQILVANKQQTLGIEQITMAISSVNEVLKHISVGSNQTREAIHTLNRIAEELKTHNLKN